MWNEPILHVDMDSFFVEVERLRDPALKDRPVAVGGTGPRGVIASASYEAREFGVRSAQPTSSALRMCPHLVVVPSDHGRYGEVSADVFEVFRSFTPLVEGLSLDEAFLDVSGLTKHYESPVAVGEDVRSSIRSVLGLPASVGVASTKFMAKLASEEAKPDGLRHVPREEEIEFLHALPARSLWGVGPATFAALERLGVETVGDIAELPAATLVGSVGPSLGRHLHDLSNGFDPRPVQPDTKAKSISVEQTYDRDLEGIEVVGTALLAHAQKLSVRLRRAGLAARTLTLKVRFGDFETVTRSHTVEGAIDSSRDLFRVGNELVAQVDLDRPVRLLGLGGANLERASEPRQLGLDSSEEWARVDDAVASIRDRYGTDAVSPARLIEQEREVPE
ncbi:MAG: DNA polymerase IV [Actinomycetota bacterium]|nr:DNA polymerase IV [Actinomycetota bacterium]